MNYKNMRAMVESKKFDGLTKSTSFRCDPRILEIEEGFNARPIDQEHVEAFKASIRAGATIPRLLVKSIDGRIIVRDGHHRREAYLQLIAEGEDIRAIDVDEFAGNDAEAIAMLLTSAQGKPLTPLQAGTQYAKLLKYGWKVGEIAAKVGRSSTHVSQMLQLTGADEDVKGMVTRKEVSANTALASVKKHGSGAKKHLEYGMQSARLAGKKKVTAKQIEGNTPKDLVKAIEVEMKSGGLFKAHDTCPQYAPLINYLRGTVK